MAPMCDEVPSLTGHELPQTLRPDEMGAASRASDEADRIRAWAVEEIAASLGGVWVHYPSSGATPVVGVVEDLDGYRAKVHARFGDHVWVITVPRSLDELAALAVTIAADDGGVVPDHAHVVDFFNRVVVNVPFGHEHDAQWRAERSQRYGADRICFSVPSAEEPLPDSDR